MFKVNYFTPCSSVSSANFEQVNADWVNPCKLGNYMKIITYSFLAMFRSLQKRQSLAGDIFHCDEGPWVPHNGLQKENSVEYKVRQETNRPLILTEDFNSLYHSPLLRAVS